MEFTRQYARTQRFAPTLKDVIALFGADSIRWNEDGTKWKCAITNERWDAAKNRRRFEMWTELSQPQRRDVIEASQERGARTPTIKAINVRTGEVREVPAHLEDAMARRGGWRPKGTRGQLVDMHGRAFR